MKITNAIAEPLGNRISDDPSYFISPNTITPPSSREPRACTHIVEGSYNGGYPKREVF